MKKRAAGPAGFFDIRFRQVDIVGGIVGVLVPDHFDEPGPAPPQADDPVAFVEGPEGDGPDGRVQTRNVATAGQNPDDALFGNDIGHFRFSLSSDSRGRIGRDRNYKETPLEKPRRGGG
jgi:hypothetical protein